MKDIERDENLVEKLSHKEALEKYKPDLVIASWIPYKTRIGFDILDFQTVRYLICIGENVGWVVSKEIYERKDFKKTRLKEIGDYCICRTDYQGWTDHSCVMLFNSVEKEKQTD